MEPSDHLYMRYHNNPQSKLCTLRKPESTVRRAVDRSQSLEDEVWDEKASSVGSKKSFSLRRSSGSPSSSTHEEYWVVDAHKELEHSAFARASHLERVLFADKNYLGLSLQLLLKPSRCPVSRDVQHLRRGRSPPASPGHISLYAEGEEQAEQPEDHAVWILTYLSLFNPLISATITCCTILTLVLLLLAALLRLCTSRGFFSSTLTRYLGPALQLLFRQIHTPLQAQSASPNSESTPNPSSADTPYNLPVLLFLLIVAPILSLPIALTSWVAAVFRIYAASLRDPAPDHALGTAGRKDDGKAAVMQVRNCWERCLCRAFT